MLQTFVFSCLFPTGKDAASPRYLHTELSVLARFLFCESDEIALKVCYEDGRPVEPVHYIPVIPMVLVNGAEGIGTGWSTKVPNYDVKEIIANIRRMIVNEAPLPMVFSPLDVRFNFRSNEVLCYFFVLETFVQKLPWHDREAG